MRKHFRSRPTAFLDDARRDWQFDVFAWLLRACGGYPKFLDTTLVLPTEDHFPDRGMTGHAAATALFRRVREHAGMSEWPCMVEPGVSGDRPHLVSTDRLPVIRYRPEQEPMRLVATFAHELARYLIDTFEEPPPGGASLHEPAVDLTAVFMGFGLFMANAAFDDSEYDLNEGELAHALAMFCMLRKISPESVDHHLNPHLRKYLRLATRDLAQHDTRFHRLRSIFAVIPIDAANFTLPTRAL